MKFKRFSMPGGPIDTLEDLEARIRVLEANTALSRTLNVRWAEIKLHANLDGLTADDHTQYLHTNVPRTIYAQHTFAPNTAQAAFLLGATAYAQTIAGLKADLLYVRATIEAPTTPYGGMFWAIDEGAVPGDTVDNLYASSISMGYPILGTPVLDPVDGVDYLSPLNLISSAPILGTPNLGVPSAEPEEYTYYVDATGGNDANTGTTPGAAWQTLTKVNDTTLTAGQSVGFKRGEVWTGQLIINNSGTSGNRILIGAYGIGLDPLINAVG